MSRAVGVDLGAEALRGVCIENAKGKLQLVSAGTLPLGELANLEDSEDKRLAVAEKLKDLVRGANLKAPIRRVAVSGKTTDIRYLMVPPVPPWRLEMLVKYEVEERSADKSEKTYDYRILDLPDIGGQYTVMLGTVQESMAQWLLNIGRSSRLGEVEIDLEALALYNAYYHGHGYDPDKTVLVVDIGAEEVTALLIRNGGLYLAKTFLGGGRRFSQTLADELKIDVLEAEDVKKREGEIVFDLVAAPGTSRILRTGRTSILGGQARRITAGPGDLPNLKGEASAPKPDAAPEGEAAGLRDDLESGAPAAPDASAAPDPSRPPETSAERRRRQISSALVKEAAALCAAFENALTSTRQQIKMRDLKLDKIYLAGAGSRVKGLREFMARRMRVAVEPLEVFRTISLERLPAEAGEALKKEQDLMAVAVGLSLAGICKGAFSFLFWPASLKERKEFWARGAFLHYAAAALFLAMMLFWFTPKHNVDVLQANKEKAEQAVAAAKAQNSELERLRDKYEELYERKLQIEKNANSGDYFLGILAELKDKDRNPPDVYLTSISTSLPGFIRTEFEEAEGGGPKPVKSEPGAKPVKAPAGKAKAPEDPDTFQAQARVYLRGFVRSGQKDDLPLRIMWTSAADSNAFKRGFGDLLVRDPKNPDDPENLFKDIRPIWTDGKDHQQGPFYLKEFVLEAFVEGTRDAKKDASGKPKPTPVAKPEAEPKPPAAPAPAAPEAGKSADPKTQAKL
ncbi:MAG: pilus assembly protein PilM [Planctomycetota bacterium]|nr:pilus assembly protein PilM [Planctomycetota bacterium]